MRRLSFALALVTLGCSSGPPGLGESCDPAAAPPCAPDLVCEPGPDDGPMCFLAPGAQCDLGADRSGCTPGADCVEVTESVDGEDVTIGRCLIGEGGDCDPEMDLCAPGLTCAPLVDGTHQCHAPLLLRGRVIDSGIRAGIAGAHVIGLDHESVAVTDVAVSAAEGRYELEVPAVREADGSLVEASFTLRSSADGYQAFPGGVRTALPINTELATRADAGWIIEGALTEVVLIPLADLAAARVSIAGTVIADGQVGGVLVVADSADGTSRTAISDARGAYTIFNVPLGDYEVAGYKAGLQLVPVAASATEDLVGVDLVSGGGPLSTVSGSINIVNAFGGAVTSVVMVVESTFSETFGRGEVPAGLRAPRSGPVSIEGAFTIEGVPDGDYVILAAFENDRLVRDPDQLIAGTSVVRLNLPQAEPAVTLADAFKVTEALAVVGPGAMRPEAVTSAPTLTWADDSSEDYYEVVVYNAYGDLVWEDRMVPGVSGSDTVSVEYGGPLEAGQYYQFRATSFRTTGGGARTTAISTTEDLLGVFFTAP